MKATGGGITKLAAAIGIVLALSAFGDPERKTGAYASPGSAQALAIAAPESGVSSASAVPPASAVMAEIAAEPPRQLRFSVAGDIMAHASQLAAAYDDNCDCYDFKPVFATAAPLFKDADVSIANLETTLPGKNYSGYPAFGAPDSLVDAAVSAGINLLTTANNHCLDKGRDGLIRTLQVLDQKGVPHLGTYASPQDYQKQHIFLLSRNGITVAMLNYTFGTNNIPTPKGVVVNRITKSQISKDIAAAREKQVDAVIVLYHFGREYLNKPDAYQRDMVAHAFASGADIVLGGHPHHVQPYKLFRYPGQDKPHLVAYSVGNFVSAQRERYTDGGMVLYFTLVKKQDGAGKPTIDITDVHHKLVWIYISHDGERKQFHILPVDAYLATSGDPKLPPAALERMTSFRDDVEDVLRQKLSDGRKR